MRMIEKSEQKGACILVLGMFDGVHMGHKALIDHALELKAQCGLPVTVCTFSKHPLSVLRPKENPPMLTTLPERAKAMAKLHVDNLCVLPFTRETADISREDFLAELILAFQPMAIVAGFNYSFGKKGLGNVAFLIQEEARYGYETVIVPPVELGGEAVSSTRIRELLKAGDMMTANTLLTRAYGITGTVEAGKKIGRTLGFPTANLALPKNKVIPRFGVYTALLREGEKVYPCVVNVGKHPTLPEGHATIEAHILGGDVSLYGKKIRIAFLHFLRPEKVYESAEALKTQIVEDVKEAEAFFCNLSAD
jgi:riboflavin kinase/FMN adenylyltransferase